MERVIKFRAWDGQKMYLPEYSGREDFHLLADGTIVETHEYGYERHELTSPRHGWMLMQFTGLTDRKGVEIYEGDLAQNDKKVGVVVWHNGGFYINPQNTLHYFGLEFWKNNIEVIGNIHEHSDLLKQL